MSEKRMALCRRQNALAKGGQAKAIESGEAEDPEVKLSQLDCCHHAPVTEYDYTFPDCMYVYVLHFALH